MSPEDIILDESPATAEDTTKDLYLTFEIDSEDYALEVAGISEIIVMCDITLVPHSPEFVKGIINLRGDIIPVLSVRSRFMKPEKPYDESTCIIVIFYEDYKLGLIVDSVKGVSTIPEEEISPPPNAKLSFANQFVKNIGKTEQGIRLMIDTEKLLAQ